MREDLVPKRPEYYVQTGSMFENPYGVPHDEIMEMLVELPSEMAAQVIFGKYVELSGLVFTGELIQMLFDRNADHYANVWNKEFRVTGDRWVDKDARDHARIADHWHKRRFFHTGVDVARQTDYTVLTTLDTRTNPARVVAWRRMNRVPWESIYREIGRAAYVWGPSILMDSTGMAGDVIMDALEARRYCPLHDRCIVISSSHYCIDRNGERLEGCDPETHIPLTCVEGYAFSTNSKKQLIDHTRSVMSTGYVAESGNPFGQIRCPPIVQLEEELSFYAWDDKGQETDTVMSLALAAWQGLEDVVGDAYVGPLYN